MKKIIGTVVVLLCIGVGMYYLLGNKEEEPSYTVAKNVEEMTQASDIVVVGEYITFDSTWNMARDGSNYKKEDEENYLEGRIYRFKILEVLKGDITDASIQVNHRSSEMVTKDKMDKLEPYPLFIEPELGRKSILFLKKEKNFQIYYNAIEPTMITFDEKDKAVVQSNADAFVDKISGKSYSDVIVEVKSAE